MTEQPYNPYAGSPPPSRSAQIIAERVKARGQVNGWRSLTGDTIDFYARGATGHPAEPEPVAVEEEPQERPLTQWEEKALRAGRDAREVLAAVYAR